MGSGEHGQSNAVTAEAVYGWAIIAAFFVLTLAPLAGVDMWFVAVGWLGLFLAGLTLGVRQHCQ